MSPPALASSPSSLTTHGFAVYPGHSGHHREAQAEQRDLQGLQQHLQPGRGAWLVSRLACESAAWARVGWDRGAGGYSLGASMAACWETVLLVCCFVVSHLLHGSPVH
jgi:D-serine deaminase-like pyridoxal phosphate-dependent protein